MATLAPSFASARALAAPMPREPPVTRATLPDSFLVIGFLHGLFSMQCGYVSERDKEIETIETHCFQFCSNGRPADVKASGFRSTRDFRKSRGITVVCGSLERARAIQG